MIVENCQVAIIEMIGWNIYDNKKSKWYSFSKTHIFELFWVIFDDSD